MTSYDPATDTTAEIGASDGAPKIDRRTLVRRGVVIGGGLTGAAALLAVGANGRNVFAQDATPSATSGTEIAEASRYADFVSKLATNLGIADSATVDTAIKTTLKQMVDADLAAGNISANAATAAKQAIDSGDFGHGLFGFGGGGKRGH